MKKITLSFTLLLVLVLSGMGWPATGHAQSTPEIEDTAWGLRFTPPEGWTQHQAAEGYLFISPTQQGILAVLPHETRTVEALRAEAQQGIADAAGTQLQLQGPIEAFRDNGLAANYTGWIEGSPARARVIGLVAPQGRGATFLMATAPQHYTEEYAALVATVAKSAAFSAPAVAQAAAGQGAATQAAGSEEKEWAEWFQGCRLSYFNSYNSGYGGGGYIDESVIDLCPGYFNYGASSETTFNTADLSGSDVYLNSNKKGAGQWNVIRQAGQPTLQLQFHDGSVQVYPLSYEDGKTYLNGRRWLRTCNPNDQVVEARPRCF